MTLLPELALAVRQPWAWAILFGGKPVENRSQAAITNGAMGIRRIAVHASKGMTREEYQEAADFMKSIGVACPPAHELVRGGIIGSVFVVGVVKRHTSPWFFGPLGLVLRDPKPCEPIAAVGALGYFRWSASGGALEQPNRWMLPAPVEPQFDLSEFDKQGELL